MEITPPEEEGRSDLAERVRFCPSATGNRSGAPSDTIEQGKSRRIDLSHGHQ